MSTIQYSPEAVRNHATGVSFCRTY